MALCEASLLEEDAMSFTARSAATKGLNFW